MNTAPVQLPSERRHAATAWPVVEIFGPTVQGEGPDTGRPAYFVRFGGCDFRCTWCDSMHAVEPATVRINSRRLDSSAIAAELDALDAGPDLVVLSGGNPALLELGPLVDLLHDRSFEVAVETQGSRWKPWLAKVDRLIISPKGPSSGMDQPENREALEQFLANARQSHAPSTLKLVIFNDEDLDYGRWLISTWPELPLHLSVGTDVGLSDADTIERLLLRLRWLNETVAHDAVFRRARIGVQQHVLAWGTRQGV